MMVCMLLDHQLVTIIGIVVKDALLSGDIGYGGSLQRKYLNHESRRITFCLHPSEHSGIKAQENAIKNWGQQGAMFGYKTSLAER